MAQHTITEPCPRGGIPRLQQQSSIALLSYGFRPFFLGAGLWATVAMVLWIGLISGHWAFANTYLLPLIADGGGCRLGRRLWGLCHRLRPDVAAPESERLGTFYSAPSG